MVEDHRAAARSVLDHPEHGGTLIIAEATAK
jgi:hypothetical protein